MTINIVGVFTGRGMMNLAKSCAPYLKFFRGQFCSVPVKVTLGAMHQIPPRQIRGRFRSPIGPPRLFKNVDAATDSASLLDTPLFISVRFIHIVETLYFN